MHLTRGLTVVLIKIRQYVYLPATTIAITAAYVRARARNELHFVRRTFNFQLFHAMRAFHLAFFNGIFVPASCRCKSAKKLSFALRRIHSIRHGRRVVPPRVVSFLPIITNSI